jgi:hypothetical protein
MEKVPTFYARWEYVTAILYILHMVIWKFGGNLVYFSSFVIHTLSRKIWQPWCLLLTVP